MKKQILNLGETLSRAELQEINGGSGTCAYYSSQGGCIVSGLSSSQAQARLSHTDDHWCCNSCGTASWNQAPNCNAGPSPTYTPEVIIGDGS